MVTIAFLLAWYAIGLSARPILKAWYESGWPSLTWERGEDVLLCVMAVGGPMQLIVAGALYVFFHD